MASTSKDQIETAPDPDEDDLDDLDDVLDSFDSKPALPSEPKPASATSPPPTTASGPGRPVPATSDSAIADGELPEDASLEQTLEKGMQSLISELGSSPEMQKQFEDMMAELIAAGSAPTNAEAAEHVKRASENMPEMPDEETKKGGTAGAAGSGSGMSAAKRQQESFQETIRKTMERVQASGDAATAATASGKKEKSEDELFAEMLQSLSTGSGGAGLEGLGNEEDFNSMLLSMMSQLTNKEILYDPMRELHEKFPAWMEAHASSEKAEDLERYKEQQRLVGEITARFERKGYSDENEQDREYIVERMQKV